MANKLAKIIHLSDLHFGKPIDPALQERLKAIIADENQQDGGEHINLLIVSGDVANQPFPWLMKRAANLIEELRQRLKKAEVEAEVIVLPGNHDYKLWGNFGFRRLTRIPFYVYFRHAAEWRKPEISLRRRLVLYAKLFFNALWPWGKLLRDELQVWTVPDTNSGQLSLAKGLVILGFNSNALAEMWAGGIVDGPHLVQLDRILDPVKKEFAFQLAFKVAVVHHHPLPIAFMPTGWLDRIVASRMILYNAGTFLRRSTDWDFDLVLHGHKHFAAFARISHGEVSAALTGVAAKQGQMSIAGAGSALHPHPDDPRGNHLQIVELFDDGTARLRSQFFSTDTPMKDESRVYSFRSLQDVRQRRVEIFQRETGFTVGFLKRTCRITEYGFTIIEDLVGNCRATTPQGKDAYELVLEAPEPSYLRGFELLRPEETHSRVSEFAGQPRLLRWEQKETSLRRIVGQVHFGRQYTQADGPFSYGYRYRLMNGHALDAVEFARKYAGVQPPVESEYATLYCSETCDEAEVSVEFPEDYKLDQIETDTEVRYQPLPLAKLDDCEKGECIHDEESRRVQPYLVRTPRGFSFRCPNPIPGFLYRIRWCYRNKPDAQDDVPLSYQTKVLKAKSQFLRARIAACEGDGAAKQRLSEFGQVLDALGNDLLGKLSASRQEKLDVTLMMFDEDNETKEAYLRIVAANLLPLSEWSRIRFRSGEGCAGSAFEKARAVLYHPLSDEIGLYISPAEADTVGPSSSSDGHGCLVCFPWRYPSEVPSDIPSEKKAMVGVISVSSADIDSALVRLIDDSWSSDPMAVKAKLEDLGADLAIGANKILEWMWEGI